MTVKESVLLAVQRLPDEASIEEIRRELEFIAAIREGLEQLDRGESVPHDEVEKRVVSWRSVSPGH
ncbi:MAG: hypothetical protein ACOYMV_09300 [Verrucomicrobiia bacterium]